MKQKCCHEDSCSGAYGNFEEAVDEGNVKSVLARLDVGGSFEVERTVFEDYVKGSSWIIFYGFFEKSKVLVPIVSVCYLVIVAIHFLLCSNLYL